VQLFAFGGRSASGDSWGQMLQFVIVPNEDGSVRLLLRDRTAANTAFDRIFSPGFFIMERRMLQGIGRRAEGLPAEGLFWEAELFLWLFAFFGFLLTLGGILARRAWHRPALLAGFAALVTLFFAFAQPPLWIDALGVAAIYAGLAWVAFSPGRQRAPRPLQVAG
jgi:hypothetical protein